MANHNAILSAPNAVAFGLRNFAATTTGHTHRVSFIPAAEEGFVYVVRDDCAGYPTTKMTTAEAREYYASRRALGWKKIPAPLSFVGTDYCGRYIYRLEEHTAS